MAQKLAQKSSRVAYWLCSFFHERDHCCCHGCHFLHQVPFLVNLPFHHPFLFLHSSKPVTKADNQEHVYSMVRNAMNQSSARVHLWKSSEGLKKDTLPYLFDQGFVLFLPQISLLELFLRFSPLLVLVHFGVIKSSPMNGIKFNLFGPKQFVIIIITMMILFMRNGFFFDGA